jgi:hypothetical protein
MRKKPMVGFANTSLPSVSYHPGQAYEEVQMRAAGQVEASLSGEA